MPNLTSYAAGDDWPAVLDMVFGLGLFRVFESCSEPNFDLREFGSAPAADLLSLFVVGAGPEPVIARTDLLDGGFRYSATRAAARRAVHRAGRAAI